MRLWWGLLTALIVSVWLGGEALAHTALREAVPAGGARLTEVPSRLTLRFSAKVEVQPGAVVVSSSSGSRVNPVEASRDPADQSLVTAPLPALEPGAYTVTWRVLSADGHPVSGTYSFTVAGAPAAEPGTGAPVPHAHEHVHAEPPSDAGGGDPGVGALAGYWLGVTGLLLLTGLPLIQALVVRDPGRRPLAGLLWIAWGAALTGTLALLLFRAAQVRGVGALEALLHPAMLWDLLQTGSGSAILWRLAVLLVAGGLLAFRRWWPVGGAGALGLLTVAAGGHAAALEPVALAVALDWAHLLGAAAWAGGLVQFALLTWGNLGEYFRRFSPLAAVSVAVLTGTGLYPAFAHVPSLEALTTTLYGQALVVKLLLVVALLALGAGNLLVAGPALRRGEPVGATVRWLVAGEVALIAAVLAATAVLTNAEPAGQAVKLPELNVGQHTRHNELLWLMQPLAIGFPDLYVTILPHEGRIGPEARLSLQPVHLGHDMGIRPIVGQWVEGGRFRFPAVPLTMDGPWEFRLTIERPGFEPDTAVIDLQVPPEPPIR